MLVFEPEPIEKLAARFPEAIAKVWDFSRGITDRPGLYRNWVFDFESGLRLIISKTKFREGQIEVHVSASWFRDIPKLYIDAHGDVESNYRRIGGKGELNFLGLSENGVPHWVVKE